ncbi:MAG TPA: PadR family transcriptional regulator [Vicinamibacterales bacterium]|nr:PadR family transcriptional regulator [Vicinamibacterales bacterium]
MGTKTARLDVLRGTLDVMILKSLSWGQQHGYAVSRWIHDQSDADVLVEEGALYPALYRLEARGLIVSTWGASENNRRARFYRLTGAGRRALRAEADGWRRYATAVGKILSASDGPRRSRS